MQKAWSVAVLAAVVGIVGGVAHAQEKAQGDPYPLGTCPVSGEALGSMGDPIILVHDGREVRLCCAGCEKKFNAEADALLEKADVKIKEQQAGDYPLATCIISGKELGDAPAVHVIGNRAVAFCCEGCPKKFKEDVPANMAKLDEAVKAEEDPVNEGGVCPVSGKALDEAAVAKVYGTDVVAFCCGGCPKKFEQNISANMKKLHEEHQG